MNNTIIHFFFIIVVFMIIIINIKKIKKVFFGIKNTFELNQIDNNEELQILFLKKKNEIDNERNNAVTMSPDSVSSNRDIKNTCDDDTLRGTNDNWICLSHSLIEEPTLTLYLDWFIKNKDNQEINDTYNFYILFEIYSSELKNTNIIIYEHDKYNPFIKSYQRVFFNTIIDLNMEEQLKNIVYNNKITIYILGKKNNTVELILSNPVTLKNIKQKNDLVTDSKVTYTHISCNPDGTFEKGISKSQREYPKLEDIEETKKEMMDLLKYLDEKPEDKKIDLDINKKLFY